MKITDCTAATISLLDLSATDCFRTIDGRLCIKTDCYENISTDSNPVWQCVCIDVNDGTLHRLHPDLQVIPLDAELVIHRFKVQDACGACENG